jgi:hypothetical protein
MKIKIEMSDLEKKWGAVIALVLAIVLYFVNRRYLYVLEAQFEDDLPKYIILKVGFILAVKTSIDIKDGNSGTIRIYGYKYKISKSKDGFDLYLNGKQTDYTIRTDSYYEKTHSLPTGPISFK